MSKSMNLCDKCKCEINELSEKQQVNTNEKMISLENRILGLENALTVLFKQADIFKEKRRGIMSWMRK